MQAEGRTRFDFNALDLEADALFQHGISAPRAVHGAVQLVGLVALGFELGVDVFDIS